MDKSLDHYPFFLLLMDPQVWYFYCTFFRKGFLQHNCLSFSLCFHFRWKISKNRRPFTKTIWFLFWVTACHERLTAGSKATWIECHCSSIKTFGTKDAFALRNTTNHSYKICFILENVINSFEFFLERSRLVIYNQCWGVTQYMYLEHFFPVTFQSV